MPEKRISILGCGWLGYPLAKTLLKNGYQVKGSTTTPAKKEAFTQAGIHPFLIDLSSHIDEKLVEEFVLGSEYLIISVPPKIRTGEGPAYPVRLQEFINKLPENHPVRAIFISSTSVYPDLNRIVTEADSPADLADNYLLQAEKMVQSYFKGMSIILRFGGLMGPEREPGRFLAGKTNVAQGCAPVNMIHLDDCIAIISKIIEQANFSGVYNACSDLHPTRKDFFTKAALGLGLQPPAFSETQPDSFKQISSEKLKKQLSYTFIYPDPLALV